MGYFFKKIKKVLLLLMLFLKKIDKSKAKPNKIWVEKVSEFYNRSMKSFLQSNDIEIYSTHNEGKSERFLEP